eukprot:1194005-Prorocentrum_minimum.AAC.3
MPSSANSNTSTCVHSTTYIGPHLLDVVLREDGCRPSNGAQVEPAVLLARVGDLSGDAARRHRRSPVSPTTRNVRKTKHRGLTSEPPNGRALRRHRVLRTIRFTAGDTQQHRPRDGILLVGKGVVPHLLGAVALGQHDHRAARRLEGVHVAVHATRGGGAERAARHPAATTADCHANLSFPSKAQDSHVP